MFSEGHDAFPRASKGSRFLHVSTVSPGTASIPAGQAAEAWKHQKPLWLRLQLSNPHSRLGQEHLDLPRSTRSSTLPSARTMELAGLEGKNRAGCTLWRMVHFYKLSDSHNCIEGRAKTIKPETSSKQTAPRLHTTQSTLVFGRAVTTNDEGDFFRSRGSWRILSELRMSRIPSVKKEKGQQLDRAHCIATRLGRILKV